MRRYKGISPNTLVLVLVLAGQAFGGPASSASIVGLTAKADVIVVGSVQAESSNRVVIATIDVERVLKGAVETRTLISVQWSERNMTTPGGRMPADYGLFFLQQSGPGKFVILPTTVGDIGWRDVFIQTPARIEPKVIAAASASMPATPSAVDRVAMELTAATESGKGLPFDLVAVFRSQRSPVLEAAFKRFIGGTDPRLRALGLRGLISVGNFGAVQSVRQQQSTLSAAPHWSSSVEEIEFYYVSTDAVGLKALGVVAIDPNSAPELRVAAAVALARIHSRPALPYLAELLGDPNPALQAAAVGGLASFANNVPIGSHEPAPGQWKYRTDETIAHSVLDESAVRQRQAYYVGFWKDWWNQNRASLSQ